MTISFPLVETIEHGPSPLHKACQYGFYDIVELLLAHPDIRVNQKNELGWTPFSLACANGRTEVVKRMLRDERVNINLGNKLDQTPLWIATYWGKIDVVKAIFASGRKIDDCGSPRRVAREKEITNIWALIRDYMDDPAKVIVALQEEIDWLGLLLSFLLFSLLSSHACFPLFLSFSFFAGVYPVEVFALIVLHSDGIVSTKKLVRDKEDRSVRFFRIASSLPMELQMILCNRLAGRGGNFVLVKDLEPALRKMVQIFNT